MRRIFYTARARLGTAAIRPRWRPGARDL